ncbi:hypothetical protein FA13DRAFT_1895009 [Coprinellus micaceus]|uniref:Uncharacterized protein n=1 Tax=Coprinellus micaceus TaxID=71717 RepID=A0A4Y7RJW2_COPMI|nr:hypothetical protein FA13DRAFT_1895009 [Coprinellus micaceus]
MDFTSSPETIQLAQGLAQPTAADWDANCREPWIDFGEDHLRPRLDEILGYMDLVSSMDSEAAQSSGASVRLVESIFPYSSITRIHLLVVLRGHEGVFRAAHSIARYGQSNVVLGAACIPHKNSPSQISAPDVDRCPASPRTANGNRGAQAGDEASLRALYAALSHEALNMPALDVVLTHVSTEPPTQGAADYTHHANAGTLCLLILYEVSNMSKRNRPAQRVLEKFYLDNVESLSSWIGFSLRSGVGFVTGAYDEIKPPAETTELYPTHCQLLANLDLQHPHPDLPPVAQFLQPDLSYLDYEGRQRDRFLWGALVEMGSPDLREGSCSANALHLDCVANFDTGVPTASPLEGRWRRVA